MFDALLAGCIPVLFDSRQIDLYKWHIDANKLSDMFILFDLKTTLESKIDVVKVSLLFLLSFSGI